MPLHVSSTMCSSSGQHYTIQHLVSSHSVGSRPVHRLREDSTCAPDGHLQCSVLSQPVHQTATYRVQWYQMLHNTILNQSSLNRCTGRPPAEWDDTRCCIIQILISPLSTCEPDGHLQSSFLSQTVHRTATYRVQSSLNLCTGRPPAEFSPLSTCAPDGHLQSVMIPDAV